LYQIQDFNFDFKMALKAGLLTALIITGVLSYGTYISRKLIQTQKCVTVLYWFFFVAGLSAVLQENLNPAHFMLMMPALGIFMAMSFAEFRKPVMAEFFHLLILVAVLFIQFYDEIEKLPFLKKL